MTEREKPLGLEMPFSEAFERFVQVDPNELTESVKLRRKVGPPERPQSVDGKRSPKSR